MDSAVVGAGSERGRMQKINEWMPKNEAVAQMHPSGVNVRPHSIKQLCLVNLSPSNVNL